MAGITAQLQQLAATAQLGDVEIWPSAQVIRLPLVCTSAPSHVATWCSLVVLRSTSIATWRPASQLCRRCP